MNNERLLRDLDSLLVDKEQKMEVYLYYLESSMIESIRVGKMKASSLYLERLGKLWPKPRKEEGVDGVVSTRLPKTLVA